MYNEEKKNEFIRKNNNFENAEVFYQHMLGYFKLSAPCEEANGKDLYDFSIAEIMDLYKIYICTSSLSRLVMVHGYYRKYAGWALVNNYVADGTNHFEEITTKMLQSCLNEGKIQSKYASRETLLEEIKQFPNPYAQAFVLGLFEGLRIEDFDDLGMNCVDTENKTVHIPGGRTLKISKELISAIEHASEEYTSYDENGEPFKPNVVFDPSDPRVIKAIKNRKGGDRTFRYRNIMRKLKETYEFNWLAIPVLAQIGAINMMLDYAKQDEGLSAKQIANKHINEIRERYGSGWIYNTNMEATYGYLFQ